MPYVHKLKYYEKHSKLHVSKEKMNFSFVLKINQIKWIKLILLFYQINLLTSKSIYILIK
jgi:hypothetical protein